MIVNDSKYDETIIAFHFILNKIMQFIVLTISTELNGNNNKDTFDYGYTLF